MNLIICIDDKNGVLFNNRRQSQDSVLRMKIAEICNGSTLYMSPYSAKQFNDECNISASEDYLNIVGKDDFCFCESCDFDASKITELYLFKWNRLYPADVVFNINPKDIGLKLVSKEDFEGSSHKKITLEVYKSK